MWTIWEREREREREREYVIKTNYNLYAFSQIGELMNQTLQTSPKMTGFFSQQSYGPWHLNQHPIHVV